MAVRRSRDACASSPPISASTRSSVSQPSGAGEHAFLLIEKSGANTEWVARRLAEKAGVAPMSVGYSGLKDRHAITRQNFSVHLPGRADPDWSALAIPGVRVLAASRHDRKLKRGVHRGNLFRIRVRDIAGVREVVEPRLALIRERGVPNYFGEQRFGRDAGNIDNARAMFAGRRMPRAQAGMALSAARSLIFNAVLAQRVEDGSWDCGLDGEVWMLAGTHSIFGPEPWTIDLARPARRVRHRSDRPDVRRGRAAQHCARARDRGARDRAVSRPRRRARCGRARPAASRVAAARSGVCCMNGRPMARSSSNSGCRRARSRRSCCAN